MVRPLGVIRQTSDLRTEACVNYGNRHSSMTMGTDVSHQLNSKLAQLSLYCVLERIIA